MPRGCYEPWGIFRKALPPKMKVSECLRAYQTGGLRRYAHDLPFEDVIVSERTPQRERRIARASQHQAAILLRCLVYVSLPLGEGMIADPFMGSGSTIAAAEAVGVCRNRRGASRGILQDGQGSHTTSQANRTAQD